MINKSLFLQRKWYFPFAYVSLRKQVHTTATPIQCLFLHLNGLTKRASNMILQTMQKEWLWIWGGQGLRTAKIVELGALLKAAISKMYNEKSKIWDPAKHFLCGKKTRGRWMQQTSCGSGSKYCQNHNIRLGYCNQVHNASHCWYSVDAVSCRQDSVRT